MHVKSHTADIHGRVVVEVEADSLASVAAQLRPPSKYFILVIAADTTNLAGPRLVGAAADLIRAGASYVCCWGPDCERLHDCFDEADIEVNGDSTSERVLMTTWHAGEPWEEALWYALNTANPAPYFQAETRTVVAVAIGNHEWARRAATYLESGAPLRDET